MNYRMQKTIDGLYEILSTHNISRKYEELTVILPLPLKDLCLVFHLCYGFRSLVEIGAFILQ